MAGKVFDGRLDLKKRLFPDKPFGMRKSQARQILSQNNSVKTQGMKNEIMKFLGFSKIWRQDSKIYFSKKKKNFLWKYF